MTGMEGYSRRLRIRKCECRRRVRMRKSILRRTGAFLLAGALFLAGEGISSLPVSAAVGDAVQAAEQTMYYKAIDKRAMYDRASANSWNRGALAQNAFDGNDATIWHQKWEDEGGSSGAQDKADPSSIHPIWIQTGFGKKKTVGKLVYKSKTGTTVSNNRISSYKLYIANLSDPEATPAEDDWKMVSSGTVTDNASPYEIVFEPQPATHIRLAALSGNGRNGYKVAAREIDVYEVCHSSAAINIKKPKAGETGDIRVRDMAADASVTFTEGLTRNAGWASDEVVDLSEGRDAFRGKYQFLHTVAGNEPLNVTGHKPFVLTFEMKIPGGLTAGSTYSVIGKRHGQYGMQVKRVQNNSYIEMFANPLGAGGTFAHYRSAFEPGHFADWTRVTALYDGYGFWIGLNDGAMTRVATSGARNDITLQDMDWTHFTIGCNQNKGEVYPGLLSDVKMYVNESALSGGAVQANSAAAAAFAKNLMKPERLVFETGISQELPYTTETKWYKDGAAEAMPASETFEAGHSYKAEVVLRSKESEDFTFAKELYWAKVDGQEIEVTDENLSLSENGRELRFEKEFYLWNVEAAAEGTGKGTISLNGRTAAANDSIVADGEQITLAATPASGYRFLNWKDENNTLISRDASVSLWTRTEITPIRRILKR